MKKKKSKKKLQPSYSPAPAKIQEKIPMRKFSDLYYLFYGNMPKVMLVNLIYAIPVLAVCAALYYFIPKLETMGMQMLAAGIAIVICYTLFSGVNAVAIKLIDKEKNFSVPKTYFKAVLKYLPKFFLHSIVVVLCVGIAFFSFYFYSTLASLGFAYALFFVFYVVFVLLMLFFVFHLPLVTIEFNGSIAEIYKTSFTMIAKNASNNIASAAIVGCVAGLCYLVVSATLSHIIICLICTFVLLLLVPCLVALTTNFYLVDRTKAYLRPEPAEQPLQTSYTYKSRAKTGSVSLNAEGEYIFYNGKMIKKEQYEKEMAMLEGADTEES